MKILELELLSDDVSRTEAFYNQVLGLNTLYRDRSSVSFHAGATKLTFHSSQNVKPVYHFAFDVPNNKLIEAFSWIESKTEIMYVIAPDKIADFYNWNAKSFYFYDNNGNILEFIARNDLDNASQNPFDGKSILSVSEMGLVSKNVTGQCDELFEKYGLTPYSKQPKLPKFIVLGTVTGLFILVEENRDWYPTDRKSKSFWTKIVFNHEGETRVLEVLE
ncbi:glyoxalase/bleomycin resistance protein/dioxygenase superfamily protein [Flavobacterium sp. 103]|uniref:VOC family protein n=1 Tax=Flavobacterium sp. 103 TaxID=2135624 RepID=UPI000D5FA792|nr:VOC family protein [Flavobacterium sp. 103]PVX44916.1 glyoxalase/bleomycin resistance protein/dioxygenase superfamily protein [Flavobacterium sp. 103]